MSLFLKGTQRNWEKGPQCLILLSPLLLICLANEESNYNDMNEKQRKMCRPIHNFSKMSVVLIFPVFRPPPLISAFIFPFVHHSIMYSIGSLQSTCNKGSKELSIKFAAPIWKNYHVAWVLSSSVVSNSL